MGRKQFAGRGGPIPFAEADGKCLLRSAGVGLFPIARKGNIDFKPNFFNIFSFFLSRNIKSFSLN